MVVGYVYLIVNKLNGKKYVGQTTTSISKRWKAHIYDARSSRRTNALHRAILKHGVANFTVTCIEEVCGTRIDLVAAEIKHIAIYDCMAPQGYNLTRGGDGADFTSPHVRRAHSEAMSRVKVDPAFQQAIRCRSSNWRAHHAEQLRALHSDADFKERQRQRTVKMHEDPEFARRRNERFERLQQDPAFKQRQHRIAVDNHKWVESNLKQIRALHAKQAEAIALRESDLSDEERSKRSEKRRRLREGSRRYRAKKKALRDRGQ